MLTFLLMGLKRYSKDEFIELLQDRIDDAGGINRLAKKLNVSNALISYSVNQVRPPSAKLLRRLGLRAEVTVNYVSTPQAKPEEATKEKKKKS